MDTTPLTLLQRCALDLGIEGIVVTLVVRGAVLRGTLGSGHEARNTSREVRELMNAARTRRADGDDPLTTEMLAKFQNAHSALEPSLARSFALTDATANGVAVGNIFVALEHVDAFSLDLPAPTVAAASPVGSVVEDDGNAGRWF